MRAPLGAQSEGQSVGLAHHSIQVESFRMLCRQANVPFSMNHAVAQCL